MVPMTTWALILQLREFVEASEWVLAPLDAIILVLALWLIAKAAIVLLRTYRQRRDGTLPDPDPDPDPESDTGMASQVPRPRAADGDAESEHPN